MKPPTLLLAWLLFSTAAFAADIALSDGRVLKNASIVSQTPRTVTVRHSQGLSSVAKIFLPAELQAKYPVNESAGLAADQRAEDARIAAQEFQQREAARAAAIQTSRQQPTENESPADAARRIAAVKASARNLIDAHFAQAYKNPDKSVSIYVTVTELTPIDNWPGHWRVIGETQITIRDLGASLASGARSTLENDTSPIGDAGWRKFHYDSQTSSTGGPAFYTPPKTQLQTASFSSSETKSFEAIYTEDPAKPNVDVRVY